MRHKMSKEPRSRSERASLQPRDSKGRFQGFETVMIIDEFGNSGHTPKPHEKTFGYAISITKKPDNFGKITNKNRLHIQELKARDDTDKNKNKILTEIKQIKTETYGYYVDKSHPPIGWDEKDRGKVMLKVLEHSIDETLPKTDGNVFVVIDYHNAYKDRIRPMLKSKSTINKIVDGHEYNSYQGNCADLLQTHDYVSNAVRAHVESNDRSKTNILKSKLSRIDKTLEYNK